MGFSKYSRGQEKGFIKKHNLLRALPSLLFLPFLLFILLSPYYVLAQCPTLSGTVSSTQPSCNGGTDGTITVSSPSGGVAPYTYSVGGTTYQSSNVITGLAGATTYTVFMKDSHGCITEINYGTYIGQPNALGASPYSTQSPSCNASNGNIVPNAFNGTAPYTYSLDGITYSSTTPITNLPAGGYTLYIKDSKGCTLAIPYTLGPLTAYTLSGTATICSGTNTTLTLSGSSTGVTYQLRNNGVNTGTAQSGTGSALSFTANVAGTYTVLATNNSTSCTSLMTGSAIISTTTPTAYTFSGGGAYCSGVGQTLTLSGSQTGVNYQLMQSGLLAQYYNNMTLTGSPLVAQVEAVVNNTDYVNGYRPPSINSTQFSVGWTGYVVPPVTGNYTFTTVSDDGVQLSVNGSMIINDFNDHAATVDNSSSVYLVAGQPYSISMAYYQDAGFAVAELEWSYPGQATQIIPSSSLFTPASPVTILAGTGSALNFTNVTSAGTYGIFATNTTSSCMNTMTATATVTNPLNLYSLSGSGTFCGNTQANLNYSDIGVNYQLQVSGVNSGSSVAGTGAPISFPISSSGTYKVLATNASTGCTATMYGSAIIAINASPTAYTIGGTGHYCTGGSGATISLSNSQTGVNYQLATYQAGLNAQYYNNMTLSGTPVVTEIDANINHADFVNGTRPTGVNSTQFSVNWTGYVLAPVTGNYIFTTIADDGIRAWVNGNEVINDFVDQAATTVNTNSIYLVAGQYYPIQVQYYQNGGNAEAVLEWSYPGQATQVIPGTQLAYIAGTGSVIAGTGSAINFTNITGTYTYYITGTNASSSCFNLMTGTVTVVADSPPTTSTAGSNQTLTCPNSPLTLAGNNPGLGTGLWAQVSGPNTAVFTNSALYNTTVTGIIQGTYVFSWTITNGTCSSSSSVSVTVNGLTSYTLSGPGSFCAGSTATLTLSGSDIGNTYQLQNGGVNSGSSQSGNGSSLLFNTTAAGTYTVLATNTTTGCTQVMTGSPVLTTTACGAQGGIIIPSGGYLIHSANYMLDAGNFTNNGSFTASGGTITFNGGTQSITGSSANTFQGLTIASGSTTTVSASTQNIAGVLTSNGTFNAGGNITLLSTPTQTALINGAGSGTISGNVIMQGYLSSEYGYKYLGSPFTSATVGQFSGPVNLSASFPPFYSYNESNAATGWVTDITTTNTLNPGSGYAVNFGSTTTALTFSLNGTVNNGTISQTLYNHNNTYTQGFNLVSNPYPSPIDWNSASGWTKTNIDNALYFYNNGTTNQYTGTYNTYINGVSSNGIVSNIIPAMQGFFVHVTNGTYPVTGTLTVNNNARNTTLTGINISMARPPRKEIRMAVSKSSFSTLSQKPIFRLFAQYSEETSDPMVIYLDQKNNLGFDPQYDALKIMNTDASVPNIYGMSTDSQRVSILALNTGDTNRQTIPLGLKIAQSGNISFEATNLATFPIAYIYFQDSQDKKYFELHQNPKISMNLNSGVYEGRFSLIFSPKPLIPGSSTSSSSAWIWTAYSNLGLVYIKLDNQTGIQGNLTIYSVMGEPVWTGKLSGAGMHTFNPEIRDGIYILSFQSSTGTFTKKVFIGS